MINAPLDHDGKELVPGALYAFVVYDPSGHPLAGELRFWTGKRWMTQDRVEVEDDGYDTLVREPGEHIYPHVIDPTNW